MADKEDKEKSFFEQMMMGASGGPAGAHPAVMAGSVLTGLLKAEAAKKLRRAQALGSGTQQVGELKRQQGTKEADILGNLMSNLRQTILF